jgi:hypothetical protein
MYPQLIHSLKSLYPHISTTARKELARYLLWAGSPRTIHQCRSAIASEWDRNPSFRRFLMQVAQ